MKDLIFRRYAELSKAWRAGLSNEVFRASVAFLILTVLFFAIALALPQIREPLVNLVVTAMGSVGVVAEDGSISPTILFFSNLQTCIFIMIYGLIPFLQLPALTLGLNAMVLGVLGAWYAAEGISPLVYLVFWCPTGSLNSLPWPWPWAPVFWSASKLPAACANAPTPVPSRSVWS